MIPQALMGLPVYLLTSNLILSYNLVNVSAFVLAGWACFGWCATSQAILAPGLFAGTIFAFAPYKIAHLSQLNLLSIEWLPFAFLCLHRLVLLQTTSKPKDFKALRTGWVWAILFGLFFLLQSRPAPIFCLYSLPLYLIYLIGLFIVQKRLPSPALLTQLLIVGIIAFLIMLPTLLPYLEVSNSQSVERTNRRS